MNVLSNEIEDAVALDIEALEMLRAINGDGRPDLLGRLIDVYLDCSPKLITKIHTGLVEKDAALVELNAHSLKSSSATLGAMNFAMLCRELEEKGRSKSLHNLAPVLDEIDRQFPRVCEALELVRGHD